MAYIEITRKRLGRTLSIDPRSRRVAWAYFRDGDLRDCRIRTFRDESPSVRAGNLAEPYLVDLLDHLSPHALLVPRISGGGTRRRSGQVARTIRTIVREAIRRGIAVHVVSHDAVKGTFSQVDGSPAKNVQDNHNAILERFPELTVMAPKPRVRIWDSEQYFTPLFKAVAMYVAWHHLLWM